MADVTILTCWHVSVCTRWFTQYCSTSCRETTVMATFATTIYTRMIKGAIGKISADGMAAITVIHRGNMIRRFTLNIASGGGVATVMAALAISRNTRMCKR